MDQEPLWSNAEGILVPLFQLTDAELLKLVEYMGPDFKNAPDRFKLELIRRGLNGNESQ